MKTRIKQNEKQNTDPIQDKAIKSERATQPERATKPERVFYIEG